MERKTELLLIIRQLKKDLCDSASFINTEYIVLNQQNVKAFKADIEKHDDIHVKLKIALNEYDQLERNAKLVAGLFK